MTMSWNVSEIAMPGQALPPDNSVN
jgi:hypothetical protein